MTDTERLSEWLALLRSDTALLREWKRLLTVARVTLEANGVRYVLDATEASLDVQRESIETAPGQYRVGGQTVTITAKGARATRSVD